jgi:hypothetical protein
MVEDSASRRRARGKSRVKGGCQAASNDFGESAVRHSAHIQQICEHELRLSLHLEGKLAVSEETQTRWKREGDLTTGSVDEERRKQIFLCGSLASHSVSGA